MRHSYQGGGRRQYLAKAKAQRYIDE